MTSSIPKRRYADGLRRLGFNGRATRFFDEHVGMGHPEPRPGGGAVGT
jgi:hypothetical protein